MNKKSKILKIMFFIILTILMIFTISNTSQAIKFDPNNWAPNSTTSAQGADRVLEIGNDVVGVIQLVGSFISVGVLVVLGIKYMMGSVEERAEYKKAMLPYFIGAIMLFAITNILSIVMSIVQGGGLA